MSESVPAERLEKDIVRIIHQHSALRGEKAHRIARGLCALLAEAREEGKPLPEISEAQLYEAVRHKSIKDRMDAVSALFAHDVPPASAGTLRDQIVERLSVVITDPKVSEEGVADDIMALMASAGTEEAGLDIDAIVRKVFDEHPSGEADFAELGRYTWPERFDALVGYLKAALAREGEKK